MCKLVWWAVLIRREGILFKIYIQYFSSDKLIFQQFVSLKINISIVLQFARETISEYWILDKCSMVFRIWLFNFWFFSWHFKWISIRKFLLQYLHDLLYICFNYYTFLNIYHYYLRLEFHIDSIHPHIMDRGGGDLLTSSK